MALQVNTKTAKTYDYVPLSQQEEEKPFTVTIKRLTQLEHAQLEDSTTALNKDESLSIRVGTTNLFAATNGIVGWKNLQDESGDECEIKFDLVTGKMAEESINLLPVEIVSEVASVIINITKDPANTKIYLRQFDEIEREEAEKKNKKEE